MEFATWHFAIGLLGLILYLATFSFGVFKWFDSKIDKRMEAMKQHCTNTSEPICQRMNRIEQEYAHKDDVAVAIKSVENIVCGIRDEQLRMTKRMDDLMKWLMDHADRRSGDRG